MTRSLLIVALAAIVATATSVTLVGAQPVMSPRIISVGLGGGVSVPVDDAKDVFDRGFVGQGFVRLNLPMLPITPRFDFTFQKFDLKSEGFSGGTAFPGGSSTALAGMANIQIPLIRAPLIEPYIVAGVGAYSIKTELDDAANTEESETKWGVNGGAGLIVKLGIVSLYAEGRVDNVFTDKGVIDFESIKVVPVTFGLVY